MNRRRKEQGTNNWEGKGMKGEKLEGQKMLNDAGILPAVREGPDPPIRCGTP